MVMADCFAYAKLGDSEDLRFATCRALTALYCKDGECKFYKNIDQACKACSYENCQGCAGNTKRKEL